MVTTQNGQHDAKHVGMKYWILSIFLSDILLTGGQITGPSRSIPLVLNSTILPWFSDQHCSWKRQRIAVSTKEQHLGYEAQKIPVKQFSFASTVLLTLKKMFISTMCFIFHCTIYASWIFKKTKDCVMFALRSYYISGEFSVFALLSTKFLTEI